MTTEEFEDFLAGAQETEALEFKQAMDWDERLIKHFLAMANLPNGGRMVIGIEDATLARQGLSPQQAATFNSDVMKDKVNSFADPMVVFTVESVQDNDGKSFIVITVQAFEELPVICKKDHQGLGLRGATIYYRTRTARPQSAPVSNSIDMRDIVLRAAAKTHARLGQVGYKLDPGFDGELNAELGGL